MRGADRQTAKPFSYLRPEALVPPEHPLRRVRPLMNAALERLSAEFDAIYADELAMVASLKPNCLRQTQRGSTPRAARKYRHSTRRGGRVRGSGRESCGRSASRGR